MCDGIYGRFVVLSGLWGPGAVFSRCFGGVYTAPCYAKNGTCSTSYFSIDKIRPPLK